MGSSSSHHSDSLKPKRLKTLAFNVKLSGGNTLLHQFVLDNSHPNDAGSEIYTRAVLMSMSDVPAKEVNALNDEGFTALHLAVLKNNLLLVNKLLSCLANINVSKKSGDWTTALHLAVELGHLSIIQELLNKGAGIDIWNNRYETAVTVAMRLHALDTVKLLVSADVNQRILYDSSLHKAAKYGSLEIAEFLIDAGADVDVRRVDGRTPLHEAAKYGRVEIAEFLIAVGADVDARAVDGRRPLHEAACEGNLDTVKLLVGEGADLHAADLFGRTALHEAVSNRECGSAIAAFLLDQGAPLNTADVSGWTPLHHAAFIGHVDHVRALLDRGADANARDVLGSTPLDLARQNQSCIYALQNVG